MSATASTPSTDGLIKLFSYYRDAEIRGATLLMKMMQREKDPEAVVLFTRHISDEMRHAWLWTKRIRQLGGFPVAVPDGYQRRIGKALGIPGSVLDLFTLTVVVEERSERRYGEHAASPFCDPDTRAVLEELTKDEKWHISWMEDWMLRLSRNHGGEEKVRAQLAHYRAVEQEIFEAFKEEERRWLGFSFSDSRESAAVAAG
ncbi:MAG TPA: ferritin-like domain-containing protein [Candidatus Limnocylindrales bacterium]|nr:ferritin-like domain-containing protein [Candidatus Limnocylindrales bacterium]